MKISIFLFAFVLMVCKAANEYNTRFDDADIDKILLNNRVLSNYIKCILDEGPCTAEGRELKKNIPDALTTECNKCTEKQKTTAEKVINFLKARRPKDWERLSAKYDPNGLYETHLNNFKSQHRA